MRTNVHLRECVTLICCMFYYNVAYLGYFAMSHFFMILFESFKHFFPLCFLRVPFKADSFQSRNTIWSNLSTSYKNDDIDEYKYRTKQVISATTNKRSNEPMKERTYPFLEKPNTPLVDSGPNVPDVDFVRSTEGRLCGLAFPVSARKQDEVKM